MAVYTIVGLGNPGEEYKQTHHNVGRIVLEIVRKAFDAEDLVSDNKVKVLKSKGVVGKDSVLFLAPDNFMNNSGKTITPFVTSTKAAERLAVVYDDIDLPIGTFKISFNRGSGGHRGIESIARALKTKAFLRIRIGIAPVSPSGKIRKPRGEKKVLDFIMKNLNEKEEKELKKVSKKVAAALKVFIERGRAQAMNEFN